MKITHLKFIVSLFLLLLSGSTASLFAQSGWTWVVMEADVPAGNPGYVDVTLGVRADSEPQSGRLGNFNIRGAQSSALYEISDTLCPEIAAFYPEHFEMTLTPCPVASVWQVNAVFNGEFESGALVTPAGIPVLTLRFFIRDTSGTSGIEFIPMSQTYTDNNMQSVLVHFDDSDGDVGLWHIVNGVEVRPTQTGEIVLIWPDEPENRIGFHVWRASRNEGPYARRTAEWIIPSAGYGEYTDSDVRPEWIYWYKIEAVLEDGSSIFIGPVASSAGETRPDHFDLTQNYPNPFNMSTQFVYQLPEASEVSAVIYNLLGQKIRTLISKKQEAGTYVLVWDGTDIASTVLPSGVYILRFHAGSFARVQKMMVIK
jgi:hypothetical protein